jgi:hypothetical protein
MHPSVVSNPIYRRKKHMANFLLRPEHSGNCKVIASLPTELHMTFPSSKFVATCKKQFYTRVEIMCCSSPSLKSPRRIGAYKDRQPCLVGSG